MPPAPTSPPTAPVSDNPEAFAAALPATGALMGLDPGTRTIGIAASDPARRLAMPVETRRRTKFGPDAAHLLALADERGCVGVVIGLPVNMDGSEGPRCQAARAFARNIAAQLALPVLLWDERLSTAAVERELIALDTSRRRRAEMIDAQAAAFILQGALDRLANLPAPPETPA